MLLVYRAYEGIFIRTHVSTYAFDAISQEFRTWGQNRKGGLKMAGIKMNPLFLLSSGGSLLVPEITKEVLKIIANSTNKEQVDFWLLKFMWFSLNYIQLVI